MARRKVTQRRYNSPFWLSKFRALAKKGGVNAIQVLDRPAYNAFRRRFNGRHGLLKSAKVGLRKDSVRATASAGRYRVYDRKTEAMLVRCSFERAEADGKYEGRIFENLSNKKQNTSELQLIKSDSIVSSPYLSFI